MAFDTFLTRECEKGTLQPTLRLYQWKPYAISLGYSQSEQFLDKEKCSLMNVDIVRRPTGGRAVYHAEEMTYSIVLPSNDKTVSAIHSEISQALVCGLKMLGVNASISQHPSSAEKIYFSEHSAACFSSVSRSEIQVNGKKIVGSAQRKFGDVILQHGSIMIGSEHKSLPKFYREVNEHQIQYLEETTTELETELRRTVSFEEVAEVLQKGFEKQWEVEFVEFPLEIVDEFSIEENTIAEVLV